MILFSNIYSNFPHYNETTRIMVTVKYPKRMYVYVRNVGHVKKLINRDKIRKSVIVMKHHYIVIHNSL